MRKAKDLSIVGMASAPERISIKRRRDDEVVDILTLTSAKKQRTSDQYFVRLSSDNLLQSAARFPTTFTASRSSHDTSQIPPGVPLVGTTQHGDEIKDFRRYKEAQDFRKGIVRTGENKDSVTTFPQKPSISGPPPGARRFHLTRDLSLVLRPQHSSGIRKAKSFVRPHLPTFVERVEKISLEEITSYVEPPVDRVIKSVDGPNHELSIQRILSEDGTVKKEKTATFQKPQPSLNRTGQSIRDDLATWDLTSDRLADELMALALEMDPVAKALYKADPTNQHDKGAQGPEPEKMFVDGPTDFVYETYVRVQQRVVSDLEKLAQSNSMGYLVIDEDEEELWEQYLRDDDDDDDEDWDEEDGDSNAEDNPRNDYPEDEVSSDDEYDRNIYKYRRDHSDDEQFDQDYS